MDAKTALEFQWPYLLSLVGDPSQLETSARRYKAFTRRRGIRSAEDLLGCRWRTRTRAIAAHGGGMGGSE